MSTPLETTEPSSAIREVLLSDPGTREKYVDSLALELEAHIREFQADVATIKLFLKRWQPMPVSHKFVENRMESLEPELKSFFGRAQGLVKKANESNTALGQLEKSLGWYEKSTDAKALLKLTLAGCAGNHETSLEKEMLATQRTEIGQTHATDEEFFQTYLNAGKPALTVYRGDGRGIKADKLDNFVRQPIPAEGNADVSFFGVVQHIESSVNKNGMISTTTARDQALGWAVDGKKFGLLYEFRVTRYIDTIELLRQRNFKHRFPAQLEILIPAQITVGEIVSVSLYDSAQTLIRQA